MDKAVKDRGADGTETPKATRWQAVSHPATEPETADETIGKYYLDKKRAVNALFL